MISGEKSNHGTNQQTSDQKHQNRNMAVGHVIRNQMEFGKQYPRNNDEDTCNDRSDKDNKGMMNQ